MRYLEQSAVVALLLLFAIACLPAATALPCVLPAGDEWNITNTTVICDNSTTIDFSGIIRIENGTLNVTNDTILNADGFILQPFNATLIFEHGAATDGSINLTNGTLTITNTTFELLAATLNDEATMTVDSSAIGILRTKGAAATQITFSDTNITGTFAVEGNGTILFAGDGNNLSATTLTAGNESGAAGTLIIDGNLSFTATGMTAFNDGQDLTRRYLLTLSDDSSDPVSGENVTILSNGSDTASKVWSGVTDANGKATFNVTFNSTTYNDTFHVALPDKAWQNASFTLLNDTPFTMTTDVDAPEVNLSATTTPIIGGSFAFEANLSADTVAANYTITNGTDTWSNGTWSSSELATASYRVTETFSGIYLPTGSWTINVSARDEAGNAHSNATTVTSEAAILATLSSTSSQTATIGGSAVAFTFAITTKGAGSVVKAYLNLTNGALVFNNAYVKLQNDSDNVSVSQYGNYTGSGNVTLPAIALAAIPSYVELDLTTQGGIYQDQLTLAITPYNGLSAGTYAGSYGFGVFG